MSFYLQHSQRFCPPFCGHYFTLCTYSIISTSLHSSPTVLRLLSPGLPNNIFIRLPIYPNSLAASPSIYSPVSHSYSSNHSFLLNCSIFDHLRLSRTLSSTISNFSFHSINHVSIHSIPALNEHMYI